MTTILDTDRAPHDAPLLPFAASDVDRYRLRMNRADFARLVGVSKQAVGDWARKGWIAVGPDGLLDPRAAMRQLLRHVDPARLRAKTLEPLVADAGRLQRRIDELERALSLAREDAEFHEESASEILAQFEALVAAIVDEWDQLRRLPPGQAIAAIEAWAAAVEETGDDQGSLMSFVVATQSVPAGATHNAEEGPDGL